MQIENCWVNLLSVFGPVAVWRLVPLPQPRAAVVAAATVSAAGAASVYSSGLRSPLLSLVGPQSASDPAQGETGIDIISYYQVTRNFLTCLEQDTNLILDHQRK